MPLSRAACWLTSAVRSSAASSPRADEDRDQHSPADPGADRQRPGREELYRLHLQERPRGEERQPADAARAAHRARQDRCRPAARGRVRAPPADRRGVDARAAREVSRARLDPDAHPVAFGLRARQEPPGRCRHHAPLHLHPRHSRHRRARQAGLDRLHPDAQPRRRRAVRSRAALHPGRNQGLMPTILITGAGRGLGLELARQYAADGWRVIGTVRDGDLGSIKAESVTVDVTDFAAVKELGRMLKGEPIDLRFCNAGIIGKRGMALGSFDYPDWDKLLRVNLLGAAAVIEALVDNVAASERRTIAVMSSRLGSIAETSGMTLPYATSKAALNLLAKALAETLRPRGITVVALSPGWVQTDMGGQGAPLTPETSVRGLRRILAGLKREDSGKFFSHDGSQIPW